MNCYEIKYDGVWEASNLGNTPDEAIENMAKDDGYESLASLCAAESLDAAKFSAVKSMFSNAAAQ